MWCRPYKLPATSYQLALDIEPLDNPPAGQVIRGALDHHPVAREDADAVHAHPAGDVGEYFVPALDFHAEDGVRERLPDRTGELDGVFTSHPTLPSHCARRQ